MPRASTASPVVEAVAWVSTVRASVYAALFVEYAEAYPILITRAHDRNKTFTDLSVTGSAKVKAIRSVAA
ncbi:hypothetical protein D3C80_619880 [compost metagenome]